MDYAMALVQYDRSILVVQGEEGLCIPVAQLREGENFIEAACRRIVETSGISRNQLVFGEQLDTTERDTGRNKAFLFKAYMTSLAKAAHGYHPAWVDYEDAVKRLCRKDDRSLVHNHMVKLERERRKFHEYGEEPHFSSGHPAGSASGLTDY